MPRQTLDIKRFILMGREVWYKYFSVIMVDSLNCLYGDRINYDHWHNDFKRKKRKGNPQFVFTSLVLDWVQWTATPLQSFALNSAIFLAHFRLLKKSWFYNANATGFLEPVPLAPAGRLYLYSVWSESAWRNYTTVLFELKSWWQIQREAQYQNTLF